VIPRATYRVQLHRDFGFADATAQVPYLAGLGISHLYCSPPLRARPGSRHGYDVVNHRELNPELGSREDFDGLVDTLHRHGMGLLVDIVPNHMGVLGGDNAWWLDVLENGASSAYADYFDIDWAAADPALNGRVLLPILGDQYGLVLERGELQLGFDTQTGYFTLRYYEHQLPIDPSSYGPLLRRALRHLVGESPGSVAPLDKLVDAFDHLPPHAGTEIAARLWRQHEKTALKAQLAARLQENPAFAPAIAKVVAEINGRANERSSFDRLDALIDSQPYRLAHWRVAGDEINYRRFFDINELAALRMERPEVFEATHRLVLSLAASGAIDGLRIDHPDGLADPAAYFARLQQRFAEIAGLKAPELGSSARGAALPLYVVVEKIVAPHEKVPADWAVHGTTGYRFANVINGLLIDASAKHRLDRAWHVFAGDEAEDFETLAWRGRHQVMEGSLAGELTVLANRLLRLAREDRRTRDFTLHSLRRALADVVAAFPVYRTYLVDKPSAQDRRFIDWAIGVARRRSLGADASVFDFIRRVLLGRPLPGAPAGLGERYRLFARRLQQYTAPVAAKGIEDTALYRHQRLISVNDVGGEPDSFGLSLTAFHAIGKERALNWPHTMLTTSTHDAKRTEDVRLRINVISELPAAWRLTVRRWSRMNRSHKRTVAAARAPTRNDEYFLYQTLIGSLPAEVMDSDALAEYTARIEQVVLKSARESKLMTSWMNPNAAYEAALSAFVHELLAPRDSNLFLDDLRSNSAVFAWYGALAGLSLAVVKFLSPGVPDLYQGCEAIEYALVDPDNRRDVDFERRHALLEMARSVAAQPERSSALREMMAHAVDGRAKFYASWCALQLRQQHGEMLKSAEYLPLDIQGQAAEHVVAFARRSGAHWVVVVATRLHASLELPQGQAPVGSVWGDTALVWPAGDNADAAAPPAGAQLVDALSGRTWSVGAPGTEARRWPLADLLRNFSVAALGRIDVAPANGLAAGMATGVDKGTAS
jgi:(1->4)-alpha-D-glucan 1-alpha-D-glucosylmutase